MNPKTPFLLTILLLTVEATFSQQDKTKSPVDTIRYFKNIERFYLNDNRLTISELNPMLNKFTSSAIEFKKYRKRAGKATIVLLTGIAGGVLALTKLNKETHFFTPYTITLFAGNIVGIPLMFSANKHIRRSVKLYNQEIL